MGVKIPYLTQTGNYAGNILKICLEVDQSGATNIQYSITKKAMLSGPASKGGGGGNKMAKKKN